MKRKTKHTVPQLIKLIHQSVAARDWKDVMELAQDLYLMESLDPDTNGPDIDQQQDDFFNDWPHLIDQGREN